MKRKLQWRGPHRYDGRMYWLELVDPARPNDMLAHIDVEMMGRKGARALAKRIGDFLKKEAK